MYLIPRHAEILNIAKVEERVLVDDLAERFNVTPQTIRKDLNELCANKLMTRIHGGAELLSGTENVEYEQRRQTAAAEKQMIGKAAAAIIPNGASLFINIGTTTEAVSDCLDGHEGLMVVTNNINVANRLRINPEIEVVITGGTVRPEDGGVIGGAAVDFIRQFKVDYAVIGASAIDADGALLDFDLREVRVAQAIIENARKVILVADSNKFDRTAPARIADLSQIDFFVTDKCESKAIQNLCKKNEVELIETSL